MDWVMPLDSLLNKTESFGFACQEVDGNDISAFLAAFDSARATKGQPNFIKTNTLVGKGVLRREGDDVTIISAGLCLEEVTESSRNACS